MRKIFNKLRQLSPNNKIIVKNTSEAIIVKGFALIVSFLTTPAFLKYFNNDVVLGVWYTLLSVLTWFLNFDLGIGNGVRNNLTKAFTQNDRQEAKKIISSGLASTGAVTGVLIAIGISMIQFADLNWLFNISSDTISYHALKLSVIFVFCAIMLRFMLTFVSSLFYAMQKSAINNALGLCVSLLQLLFICIFHFDTAEDALIALSFAYLLISNLPTLIAGIVIFFTVLKDCRPSIKCVDREHWKKVMSIGSAFFICQISYMLIANTNEVLITKLFSPEFTTEYTYYYKLTSLITMLISLALTPIWSVVTKAMVEDDYAWLNKLFRTIKLVGIISIVVEFAIIPILQFVMNLWLGKGVVDVNIATAIAFACFGGAFVYSNMLSTIACGMARVKLQMYMQTVGVIVKFAFVVIATKIFHANWDIVVWSNALVLIPYCIAQQIDFNMLFKRKLKEKQTSNQVDK